MTGRAGRPGAATWVEITNASGGPLAGVSAVLPDLTIDGRVSADDNDGTSRVYTLNLATTEVRLFASPQPTDLATGLPVGVGLRTADTLAIDSAGTIYIIEDRNGGVDDDIWFANDMNKDGDLLDEGEGRNRRRAFVNIQHPTSGVDRLIEISAAPQFDARRNGGRRSGATSRAAA